MSGIAGLLNLDGRAVKEQELSLLQEALLHRGPDKQELWTSGCIGLIHNHRAIDSEPPFFLRRGENCLILDGRIDNLSNLLKYLGESLCGKTLSAAEVILEIYNRWKEKALPLLLGDYALALWDGRQKRLLLARDPIGMKPLFYFQEPGRLIFASEIKAILTIPEVPCEADQVRLKEFERFRFRSMERTFFKGLRRLAPGEFLAAEGSSVHKQIFWQPNPKRQITLANRDAYRKRFRELFVEAVRCRLPKEGRVAIRLSGGLDSSSIAGVCARLQKTEVRELSFTGLSILSDLVPDERQYLETICQATAFESVNFLAEKQNMTTDIEQAIYHQESPVFEAMDPWILHQHKMAGGLGARVVLGGDWGDQVMGSTAYLVDLLRQGEWRKFFREFWLYPKNEGGYTKDLVKLIFWYLLLPARISDRYEGLRYLLRKLVLPFRPIQPGGPKFPRASQREHYDGVYGIHNVQLLEMLDKMANQCGVEARLPFLDRRLVTFTMAIPSQENIRDGWGRRLEREALEGFLPESIARRKDKGDFTDLQYLCLKQAGFCARTPELAENLWRQKIKDLWEELWIQKKGQFKRKNTSRPVLSPTAI